VRQTPHAETRMRTCPGPATGSGTSAARRGRPGASRSTARIARHHRGRYKSKIGRRRWPGLTIAIAVALAIVIVNPPDHLNSPHADWFGRSLSDGTLD